jgi:Restriction endonuclease
MGFVTRASGRLVAAVTLILYPGVGLILPVSLHWSTLWLVEANVLGALFAGAVSLGWFSAQVEAAKRRHLVEWTTSLRNLNPEEFEWLVGETYRREGWSVRETGMRESGDGNIDLELTWKKERKLVQCKRWHSQLVGVDEIRSFAGTLLRKELPGTAGIFVTLSDFTEVAQAEAKQMRITTVNGRELYARVEKARRFELCEKCGQPMRFDRSAHGWWLRCVRPGCSGKRDLGNDPGRAVEFLTQSPPLA